MEINVKKGKILERDSNMNKDERTIFWNALLEARNLKDIEKVYATIKLPKFVYRYRAVNEYSLSALGKNELFFSTSNYYDDPFDTYFHINWDMPKKMATALNNGTVPEPMFSGNEYLRSQVAKAKGTDLTGATENVIGYLKEIRNDMRKNTWSICFSESFDNENLWLKYADRHKGFVMEYEVKQLLEGDMRVIGCGLCDNCKNNSLKAAIWPVYYAKEKYDATEYASFCAACKLFEQNGMSDIVQQLLSEELYTWDAMRVILTKKWVHHYDEEWRLVLAPQYNIKSQCKPLKECKPSRIILGLNIECENQQKILFQAKNAGIGCCHKMTINDADDFVVDERNLL